MTNKRMSTAVAQDLASRRRRQQSAATILLRTYDELLDVPMRYWRDAGEGWRRKVMAVRQELHKITGMEVDNAGRAEAEEQRRQSEQRGSTAGSAGTDILESLGFTGAEDSSSS